MTGAPGEMTCAVMGCHSTSAVNSGPGTLTLTANNTYTNGTVISNGVLAISDAGLLGTSSSIEVKSGATLDASAAGLTLAARALARQGRYRQEGCQA